MSGDKLSLEEIKKLSDVELKEKLGMSEYFNIDKSQRPVFEKMLANYGHIPTDKELPTMESIDKKFEEADKLEAQAKSLRERAKSRTFKKIKREYGTIRNAEKLLEKRIETIMSNTAYVDNEMILKDQRDTKEHIAYIKDRIEENYKKINPELAALRAEEKNKVEKGMDPRQAQKERREAVKTYYNKKSQREM